MKTVTADFKTALKTNGRQITAQVIYGATTLGKEDLINVIPSFNGNILKTVMKAVTIEANAEIPEETSISVRCGVLVGDEYEYIEYGDYVVYTAEYNADTLSWVMTCYDKMIESMIDYNIEPTYPITVVDYLSAICTELEWTFASVSDTFTNYDVSIPEDVHIGINYTYRDVLDELAQVTGSTICFNSDNELEIRYITESSETIDETYLKSVNVTVKEKYGPINSLVFSRSEDSDTIYTSDLSSIATNGLTELNIKDNQLLNGDNRDDFLTDLFTLISGTEYYIYDIDSIGIMFLELCDRFTLSIGGESYSTVLFNDTTVMSQGLVENSFVEMPSETITKYSASSDTDNKINMATLIVNKQLLTIESRITSAEGNITTLEQTTEGFETTVEQTTENTETISTLSQSVDDFTVAFLNKGYANLIIDSILNFGGTDKDEFTMTGTWGSYQNSEISNSTVSNYLAKCDTLDTGVGKLEWTIRTIPNVAYSLAIKYNNASGEESSCIVDNNGITETLFDTTEEKTYEEERIGFIASGSSITLTIETDGTGFSYSDLMLNYGVLDLTELTPNTLVWQPAVGEVAGTNIRMSYDGIEIYMLKDESGTYTLKHIMDASGSRIVDENDNIITSFDVDGMTTVKATVDTQIDLGNFSFLALDDENMIEY